MRLSKAYWKTLKEVPSDAELISHQLLMRAGLIHKAASGLYSYLPFAMKSIHKIENIIREELEKIDCNEIQMSMVTPGKFWKESGRWDTMGPEMLRVKDRGRKDLCLSPTNEEAVTAIFRDTVSSYKQLPIALYQINTKFRDEVRPRFGLMRCREFLMKDGYSFHMDKECMDVFYKNIYAAYEAIFSRIGLNYTVVEADGGAMAAAGAQTHEFQVLADNGEDTLICEKSSGYSANIEKAQTRRASIEFAPKSEMSEVSTPDKKTIKAVCDFLECPQHHSLKSLVYTAMVSGEEKHYLILLLGDDDLNEVKLKNLLGAELIVASSEKVLNKYELLKGYIGPIGIPSELKVLVDEAVCMNSSFVVGANKPELHLKGFVVSRDLSNAKHVDLRMAKAGDIGPNGSVVETIKGVEVGHIFQLGDKYSTSMKATVLDNKGKHVNPLMGCYGIGVTRTMQAAIEQCHDDNGIVWPVAIAPYQVYFAVIGKSEETAALASEIYKQLQASSIEVVFDDRGMGPGGMFKDADLLGLPIRVLLGERDYRETNELEIKLRKSGDAIKVRKENLIEKIKEILGSLS